MAPEQLRSRVATTTRPVADVSAVTSSSLPPSPRTATAVVSATAPPRRAARLGPRARSLIIGALAGLALLAVGGGLWRVATSRARAADATANKESEPHAGVAVPPAATSNAAPAPPSADAAASAAANAEPTAPAEEVAEAPAEPPAVPVIATKTLSDEQILTLFMLESAEPLPSCAQRQAAAAKKRPKGAPRVLLKSARRALLNGERDKAHQLMCEVTRRFPSAKPAQQDLTDLALRLGDWDAARQNAEKSLARSRGDKVLLILWGDALAQSKNLEQARRAWLSTAGKGNDSKRSARLAGSFNKLGRGALKRGAYEDATRFYRRSLILTQGAVGPSVGFGEALLGQGENRAALAWAERAVQVFPKDGRIQLLLGDAFYENGNRESAREAWSAALALRPNDRDARRRVNTGQR
jgi:tetratricopeptide (TPR) repeat protein